MKNLISKNLQIFFKDQIQLCGHRQSTDCISNDRPHIKILQGIPSSITHINNQRTMQLLIEKEITNNGIVYQPASRISCVPFKSKLSFCNN